MAQEKRAQMELLPDLTPSRVAGGRYTLVYTESEQAFKDLSRKDYAAWVKAHYPWQVWTGEDGATSQDEMFEHPGWFYGTMIRAHDDPEDVERTKEQRRHKGYKEQWYKLRREAKADPAKARRTILRVTKDGRPRTLNRIAFEAWGQTGDILPDSVRKEFFQLVLENRLAFRIPDRDRGEHVFLFWNDETWRKHFWKKKKR